MKKIILFAVGGLLLFSGCAKKPDAENSQKTPNLSEKIENLRAQKAAEKKEKTVGISLENAKIKNGKLSFEIWLDNPDGKKIAAVRSFLTFNPKVFSGDEISVPPNSPFHIAAPDENTFDQKNGLVKIGLAAKIPNNQKTILLARVQMTRLLPVFSTIDFYDFGKHTAALEPQKNGAFKNVLKIPKTPALVISPQK